MRNKTTISNILLFIIGLVVFLLFFLSYAFYRYTNNSITTKVKSTDFLSIDSIKRASVEDTVKYFELKIGQLKKDGITRDIENSHLTIEKINYEKTIDSLERKVYYYREKSRLIKRSVDTSK